MESKQKNNDEKYELLLKLLKIIHIDVEDKELLNGYTFERNILLKQEVIDKYYDMIKNLKKQYTSDMLTCLHMNSINKQKFPGINMLRQILKSNGFKLKPKVVSMGYAGDIKMVKRFFVITPIEMKK
tara:strand:- start:101 stop:481 length:381 start_codon:yes stop_codon:yes gene_type:complete